MTAAPQHLSDKYWASLSEADKALYARVRPMPKAAYSVDIRLNNIKDHLEGISATVQAEGGSFELNPDFQRGHVWTDDQRSAYMESLIRKAAPVNILFNCPGWSGMVKPTGDLPNQTFQCIDGLQRLTAVSMFMDGQVTVFGGLRVQDLLNTPFSPKNFSLHLSIYEFENRADLLAFYLDLNNGGTRHEPAELQRVEALLRQARGEACS